MLTKDDIAGIIVYYHNKGEECYKQMCYCQIEFEKLLKINDYPDYIHRDENLYEKSIKYYQEESSRNYALSRAMRLYLMNADLDV